MNERIRELNMQAAEYATSVCPTHSRDWYPIQNTKFAELIIRECAELFKLVHTDEQYQRRIDKTIYKHFGLYE